MIMTAQLMTLGDIILQPFGISQLLEDVQCADAVKGTLWLELEIKMQRPLGHLLPLHTALNLLHTDTKVYICVFVCLFFCFQT